MSDGVHNFNDPLMRQPQIFDMNWGWRLMYQWFRFSDEREGILHIEKFMAVGRPYSDITPEKGEERFGNFLTDIIFTLEHHLDTVNVNDIDTILHLLGNIESQFELTPDSIKNRLGNLALKLLAARNRL